MTNKGNVYINRSIWDWCEANFPEERNRVYSKCEALHYLIENACFDSYRVTVKDRNKTATVELKRGEFYHSQRTLAEIFNWKQMTVKRFLDKLVETQTITREPVEGLKDCYYYIINNYDAYQTCNVSNNVSKNVSNNVSNNLLKDSTVTTFDDSKNVSNNVSKNVSVTVNEKTVNVLTENVITDTTSSLRSEVSSAASQTNENFSGKDSFSQTDLYNLFKLNYNGSVTKDMYFFISKLYKDISSSGFRWSNGSPADIQSVSDFLVKKYTVSAAVPAPFTESDLRAALKAENPKVVEALVSKYKGYEAKNWKTNDGKLIELSWFTTFWLEDTRKAFGITSKAGSLSNQIYDVKILNGSNFFD